MKRIIFLIFFSLALVAIPFAAFASDTEATSTEEVLIEAYSAEYYPTPTPTPTPEPSPTPTPEPTPTPTPENHLPIFSGPANASTTLGVTLEFEVTATDPDGDILELSSVLPEGALWATSTVKFTWTPVATSSLGTTTAKFFAFDCIGTSTHEVVIEVFPAISTGTPATTTPNRPPVFVNFNPPTSATSTVEYSYDADAEDPDLDPICFCLAFSPSGMNISTSTGLISWTPTAEQASTTPYGVTVCVSDGNSTTSTSYQILVARSTATTTETTPPPTPTPTPPPAGGSGGGGGGGSSTPPPASSGGGGGGGPIGQFGTVNVPPPSPVFSGTGGPITPAPTAPAHPPTGGPTPRQISPPKSDSAPLKPVGGIIDKPLDIIVSAPTSTPSTPFFGLGALSLLGLLNPWNWIRAHCCLFAWIIWLLTVIGFLTYIYYLKHKKNGNNLPPPDLPALEKTPPNIMGNEFESDWEWQRLKEAQERDDDDNLL